MADKKPLRADAQRNRARVIEVAARAFADEGLSVPVHEIARRAGVGTGTVSRHFPTKDHLFEAILCARLEDLAAQADRLATQNEPGDAFNLFFATAVHAGAADRGLAERVAAAAGDNDAREVRVGARALCDRLGELLERAQEGGAVRLDISLADVEALLVACMSRAQHLDAIVAVVTDGLQARNGRN